MPKRREQKKDDSKASIHQQETSVTSPSRDTHSPSQQLDLLRNHRISPIQRQTIAHNLQRQYGNQFLSNALQRTPDIQRMMIDYDDCDWDTESEFDTIKMFIGTLIQDAKRPSHTQELSRGELIRIKKDMLSQKPNPEKMTENEYAIYQLVLDGLGEGSSNTMIEDVTEEKLGNTEDMGSSSGHETKGEWDSEAIEIYNTARQLFAPATSRVITETLTKYLKSNPTMVEIGSGMGDFAKMAEGFTVQQTELVEEIVLKHLAKKSASNIQQASGTELHEKFGTEAFDAVVGLSTLDVMTADILLGVLQSANLVLKPSGMLFHFMDLNAFAGVAYQETVKEGFIPVPKYQEEIIGKVRQLNEAGVQKLSLDKIEELKVLAAKDKKFIQRLEEYVADPFNTLNKLRESRKGQEFIQILSETASDKFNAPWINLDVAFQQRISPLLGKAGFDIIEFGQKVSSFDLAKQVDDKDNLRVFDRGVIRDMKDNDLEKGVQRMTVKMLVLVAQKKG